KKAFLFCPDGVVSALKQPFFSKNSKKTNTKTMFVCNLRLHWSLSLIKSSQQRLILIFEEH
ncbi:hypothetical protein, partial [Streptococcus suis]|uniref:hypothetical protein n=1 Tax=Streptococcus suis TaxID=1307 RepID=UPI0037D32571